MANQANYTLSNFKVSTQDIIYYFNSIVKGKQFYNDLKSILKVGINDMSLFPNIRLHDYETYKDYLNKWVKGYVDATQNPPSLRAASPKGSCSDPAIQKIVQIATNSTDQQAATLSAYHNLFMSAENIQGNLLEEYISKKIHPYGWIWCNGNVLRAVDFCSADGTCLLQVKNKSNTENSSSSAIRTGTTIQKWYRLGTRIVNGINYPSYKWDALNIIINSHVPSRVNPDCNMSENDYLVFLTQVATNNKQIITYK